MFEPKYGPTRKDTTTEKKRNAIILAHNYQRADVQMPLTS